VAQAVARYQAVERDLAVIVAEHVTHAELMAAVWSAPSQGLLRDAVLFDVYRPQAGKAPAVSLSGGLADGEKSLAVRLTLNSDEATLTEAQIEAVMNAQLAQLTTQLNARLRA
jgi:phenylalanyl-tRNA synthetase beta chain